ncbi:MAG: hypothetical protein ACLFSL_04805 [Candidatus Woesearchaeota archaeon]
MQDFFFDIHGSEGSIESFDFNETLSRSGIERFSLDFDTDEHGSIESIKVIPKATVVGSDVPAQCSDKEKEWEELLSC